MIMFHRLPLQARKHDQEALSSIEQTSFPRAEIAKYFWGTLKGLDLRLAKIYQSSNVSVGDAIFVTRFP